MRTIIRSVTVFSCLLALSVGAAQAKEHEQAAAVDPAQQAAMEAMKKLGSPGEGHKALEPLAGNWNYTLEWRMAPDASAQAMTGTAVNTWVFGGRFLRQEVTGSPMAEGEPPFEGMGLLGYDNMRQEYQSVWLDNMMTGMMRGVAQYDPAAKTLAEQGTFSCPMTGEKERWYRTEWKIVDADHAVYSSYSKDPQGNEFKSMEIQYARAK